MAGRNNHLFHSCLVYSVWGCGDRENTTWYVQSRGRYTVRKKKPKKKNLTEQKISEASVRALLHFFDNEKTRFSIFGNVCLSAGA